MEKERTKEKMAKQFPGAKVGKKERKKEKKNN